MKPSNIKKAVDELGQTSIAAACGVSQPAVNRWAKLGKLPRTELTGETRYAQAIASLMSALPKSKRLTVAQLTPVYGVRRPLVRNSRTA